MIKTKWFSVNTPPARAGWYEGRYDSSDSPPRMYFFNAIENTWMMGTSDGSLTGTFFGNIWKDTEEWRGLTEMHRD